MTPIRPTIDQSVGVPASAGPTLLPEAAVDPHLALLQQIVELQRQTQQTQQLTLEALKALAEEVRGF